MPYWAVLIALYNSLNFLKPKRIHKLIKIGLRDPHVDNVLQVKLEF